MSLVISGLSTISSWPAYRLKRDQSAWPYNNDTWRPIFRRENCPFFLKKRFLACRTGKREFEFGGSQATGNPISWLGARGPVRRINDPHLHIDWPAGVVIKWMNFAIRQPLSDHLWRNDWILSLIKRLRDVNIWTSDAWAMRSAVAMCRQPCYCTNLGQGASTKMPRIIRPSVPFHRLTWQQPIRSTWPPAGATDTRFSSNSGRLSVQMHFQKIISFI